VKVVRFVASGLEADGTGLFAAVCQNDLEGIVGKWKHGPYLDGRRN
jgi:ATP-dependent DNA ligase